MYKKVPFLLRPLQEKGKKIYIYISQEFACVCEREQKPFKINGNGGENEEGGKGRENNNGERFKAQSHKIT